MHEKAPKTMREKAVMQKKKNEGYRNGVDLSIIMKLNEMAGKKDCARRPYIIHVTITDNSGSQETDVLYIASLL